MFQREYDFDDLEAQALAAVMVDCCTKVFRLATCCGVGRSGSDVLPAQRAIDLIEHLVAEESEQHSDALRRLSWTCVAGCDITRV
jgi:hypothetical protein